MALQACSTPTGLVLLKPLRDASSSRISRADSWLQSDLARARIVTKSMSSRSVEPTSWMMPSHRRSWPFLKQVCAPRSYTKNLIQTSPTQGKFDFNTTSSSSFNHLGCAFVTPSYTQPRSRQRFGASCGMYHSIPDFNARPGMRR